ncbi:MAG: PrsW family intramembrane metalloprotease [Nocardioidaceae bacterium]|nr:PrsW family intramembrane metalloprotease [Nocardioidaceae bacterium]
MTSAALLPAAEATHPSPGRRRGIVAAVILVIAAIVMATSWALYDELHGAVGQRAFWWSLLFAFLPVLPLTALFVWLDRLRPEPAWMLVVALLYGALVATYLSLQLNGWLAGLVGDRTGATPRSAVFVAPWTEEATKALVIFVIVIWRRHDFNAVVAGIVYGGLTGIGFAFTENIVYYGQLFQQVLDSGDGVTKALDAVQRLFVLRGVGAPFVHPMFTLVTGLGVGLAVRYRHIGVRILAPVAGYCGAVMLHMGYNTIASFTTQEGLPAVYVALLVPTLLTLVTVALVARRYESRVIAARLTDYSTFGWLNAEHVPYIVSWQGRRQARRHVKPYGKAERRRLKTFQRAGVDLGLLRDRLVRGVEGARSLPRERALIASMRELRGRVVLPDAAEPGTEQMSSAGSSW